MSFLFKKIGTKLWRNAVAYLFLVLEFSLGVSFLVFARNATLSTKELQAYYRSNYTHTTVSLSYTAAQLGGAPELAITPNDVQTVRLQFPKAQLRYRILQYLNFVQAGTIQSANVLYCDVPEFEKKAFTAFVGKNVMALLKNGKIEDVDKVYVLEENSLAVNGQNFSIAPLPNRLNGKMETAFPTVTNAFFSMDDCILLPVWAESLALPQNGIATLAWDIAEQSNADYSLNAIQETLFQTHKGSYSYQAEYPLRIFERSISDGLRLNAMAGKLGILMFLELLIGFSGLMLLFLKKREKELAICLAVGAKRRVLALELVCEIGCVCLLGVVFGILAGNVMTTASNEPDAMLQLHVYAAAAVPAVVAAMSITLISAMPMLYRIYTAQPDRILRGE
ncbi:MAG: ABC transporter permease [Ruthenibacterium sp.]